MPIISCLSGNFIPISRSVGFPPPKATIVRSSAGVFQITNYMSMFRYTLTVTNGTVSNPDSSGYFNMSSADVTCTVVPSFGPNGPSTTVERKSYTYTPDTRYSYPCGTYYTGGECTSATYVGTCGGGNCSTGCENLNYCCTARNPTVTHTAYCSGGSAPALIDQTGNGYTNGGNEWYKIT
jgi:hypothetical protein